MPGSTSLVLLRAREHCAGPRAGACRRAGRVLHLVVGLGAGPGARGSRPSVGHRPGGRARAGRGALGVASGLCSSCAWARGPASSSWSSLVSSAPWIALCFAPWRRGRRWRSSGTARAATTRRPAGGVARGRGQPGLRRQGGAVAARGPRPAGRAGPGAAAPGLPRVRRGLPGERPLRRLVVAAQGPARRPGRRPARGGVAHHPRGRRVRPRAAAADAVDVPARGRADPGRARGAPVVDGERRPARRRGAVARPGAARDEGGRRRAVQRGGGRRRPRLRGRGLGRWRTGSCCASAGSPRRSGCCDERRGPRGAARRGRRAGAGAGRHVRAAVAPGGPRRPSGALPARHAALAAAAGPARPPRAASAPSSGCWPR